MPSPPPSPPPLYNYTDRRRRPPNGFQTREVFSKSRHQIHKEQTKIQMHGSVCVATMLWLHETKRTSFPPNISAFIVFEERNWVYWVERREKSLRFFLFALCQRSGVIVGVLFILVSRIDHQNSIRKYIRAARHSSTQITNNPNGLRSFNLPNIV